MQESVDRVAMIEAASRSLRQQMPRAGARGDRPRSKGGNRPPSGGGDGSSSAFENVAAAFECEGRGSESSQRRIRSAENQHRQVAQVPRDGHETAGALLARQASLDGFIDDDVEASTKEGGGGLEDDYHHFELPQDLKRPLSRKKDPSASAAAGLGAFAGPERMNAFEQQKKTRQPIPVESWGPRPPSRAGVPQKAPLADSGLGVSASLGRTSAKATEGAAAERTHSAPLGSTAVGGTWARAREEPRGPGSVDPSRRGRERKAASRGTAEATYPPMDLGVFGSGKSPTKQLSKSMSGAFDQALDPSSVADAMPGSAALEVTGSGLGDGVPVAQASGAWPGTPSGRGRHSLSGVEPVSVEDIDGSDVDGASHRQNPAQVIVTRGTRTEGRGRGDVRRGSDQRGRGERMPFSTSLDVDFLSLFAS